MISVFYLSSSPSDFQRFPDGVQGFFLNPISESPCAGVWGWEGKCGFFFHGSVSVRAFKIWRFLSTCAGVHKIRQCPVNVFSNCDKAFVRETNSEIVAWKPMQTMVSHPLELKRNFVNFAIASDGLFGSDWNFYACLFDCALCVVPTQLYPICMRIWSVCQSGNRLSTFPFDFRQGGVEVELRASRVVGCRGGSR